MLMIICTEVVRFVLKQFNESRTTQKLRTVRRLVCYFHSDKATNSKGVGSQRLFLMNCVFQVFTCISLCASQEAALHEELHPHPSVRVIHPEGHRRIRQRCCPLRGRRGGQLLLRLCELIIGDISACCGCFSREWFRVSLHL